MADQIEFHATIAKVQTLADGGIRVTLDLPETAILQAAQLMTVRQQVAVVDVVATARMSESLTDFDHETKKDAKRGGSEMDSRRIAIRRDK